MKKSRRKFYKLGIALMCVVTLLAINMMPQGFGFYGKATADSISKKLELKVSPEQESYKAGDEIVVKTEYKNETDGGSSEKQFVVDLKYSKDFLELKDGEEYQVVTLKKGDTAKLEYRFKVDKDISDIKDKIEVNVKEDGEISFVRQAVTRSLSKAAATAIPKLKRSNNSGVFRVVKNGLTVPKHIMMTILRYSFSETVQTMEAQRELTKVPDGREYLQTCLSRTVREIHIDTELKKRKLRAIIRNISPLQRQVAAVLLYIHRL